MRTYTFRNRSYWSRKNFTDQRRRWYL